MSGTPGKTSRPSVKKPYKRPQLVKLGTLRDLTNGSSGSPHDDGLLRNRVPLKTGRGGRDGRGRAGN
jgi:hypothetical protein